MKKSLSLLFFLPLLLFSACKKKQTSGPSSATGYVREHGTNLPIRGANVYVTTRGGNSPSSWNIKTVISAQTDSNGYFSLNFEYEEGKNYELVGRKDLSGYFGTTDPKSLYLKPGDNHDLQLFLRGWAFVKFNIVNKTPKDTLFYIFEEGAGRYTYNVSKDTVLYVLITAQKPSSAKIVLSKLKGVVDSSWVVSQQVVLEPRDTVTFNIDY